MEFSFMPRVPLGRALLTACAVVVAAEASAAIPAWSAKSMGEAVAASKKTGLPMFVMFSGPG
jgi:hypothetical protein